MAVHARPVAVCIHPDQPQLRICSAHDPVSDRPPVHFPPLFLIRPPARMQAVPIGKKRRDKRNRTDLPLREPQRRTDRMA